MKQRLLWEFAALSPPIVIRKLVREDLHCGFLDVLAALTQVNLTPEAARGVFEKQADNQHTFVAVEGQRVIGTLSLLVEQKFIHSGGRVGHIEDVAVKQDLQSRGVGSDLVKFALDHARQLGCYKVILHCSIQVQPFYERLGFRESNVGMRIDLSETKL